MRGRPVTGEEFERMLDSVAGVRKLEPDKWRQFIKGLWLSGLRLSEALGLSWDDDAPLSIDTSGKHPCFRIAAKAQKRRKDELLPMTPDFADFILATPEEKRRGLVFGITTSRSRVGRNISAIGKKANVVVDKQAKRFATAHDLRRAFGTRWAKKVKPHILMALMRHASITTTMSYYVHEDAQDVANELWERFGDTFGETPSTEDASKTSAQKENPGNLGV
mgnify:CR=1 FL=1